MEEINKTQNTEYIDLRQVFARLYSKKKQFFLVWVITFVLACVYILPQPRVYESSLVLAPEMNGESMGGALSGIASSFGIDLGGGSSSDAIYPELYPDVMSTNKFLVDLLYTNVKNGDGTINMTYYDYLTKECKSNPYAYPFKWCGKQISKMFSESAEEGQTGGRLNPNHLTKKQDGLVGRVRKSVVCDVDIKTNVITISAKAQDPVICTNLADTACVMLQKAITDYRTNKARIDANYYKQLLDSAKVAYNVALQKYSSYCDSHQEMFLQANVSERDKLENDLQTALNTVNAEQAQYQVALAKVRERTPAFITLSEASVPVKASEPKRMIFVALMLILSTIGEGLFIYRKELLA